MKGFPDGPADELFRRLRDYLVELLGRRTCGPLHDSVDSVSGGVTQVARAHRAAAEHGGQQIAAGSRDTDPASDSGRGGTEPNNNPALGQAEHFVLRLTQKDRTTFASLADKLFGLQNMTVNTKIIAELRERRGQGGFSESEKELIEILDNMQAEQGGKLGELDLQFRWVSASESHGVPQLVEDARVHGGAAPKEPWTHIGDSVVKDFMAQHQGPGVLFIYDGGKLTSPTREEMDADWADPNGKHMYMYARKPKPGLELKDALLGMIRFD